MSAKTKRKASSINKLIGQNLRRLRKDQKLNLKTVAAYLGVTWQQVQKYEIGQNKMSAEALYIVSRVFNIPMELFFEQHEGSDLLMPINRQISIDKELEIIPPSIQFILRMLVKSIANDNSRN